MRALKKAVDRFRQVPKDVESSKGKQRGGIRMLESMLVGVVVHRAMMPRRRLASAGRGTFARELDRLIMINAIAGQELNRLHVHRQAAGGEGGRVLAERVAAAVRAEAMAAAEQSAAWRNEEDRL